MKHHADLLTPEYWQQKQARIQQGKVEDVFPYPQEIRFQSDINKPGSNAHVFRDPNYRRTSCQTLS
jgi:isocitrate dehydrogenase kinase/phosphatase